jgi:D-beta-D-heptose 7-phosphate kinase/D-beta-D-heptose 1-phosphate adenosyltransferase
LSVPEHARLQRLTERFEGRRVLVIGDVMLDRFVWGEVDRISPEAPVPVVRVRRESVRLGGAANVAANLASLGAEVCIASVVGADAAAEQLRSGLTDRGIEARLVEDARSETTVKTRVIARAQQVVRVDREAGGAPGAAALGRLLEDTRQALGDAEALVVSDYEKGVVGKELLETVLPRAVERTLPVIVDPKLSHFFQYEPSTVLTPNQAEAARATAMTIASEEDCLAAARAILARLDTRAVLVTRGERGMLLAEREGEPTFIPAVAREVYDVTGAGDTVAATLALALAAGGDLAEAAVLANLAAGVVVGKVGTATVDLAELSAKLDRSG